MTNEPDQEAPAALAEFEAKQLQRKPFKCDGTFDIEASDWDVFVLGVCYDGSRPHVFHDPDAMLDFMRKRGGIWFGHAMGIYDGLLMLERARVRGIACQVDRSQHRVTRIVMGSLTLRDSYSLWPSPLDELCEMIGKPAPHLPWACTCGRSSCACGQKIGGGKRCVGCGGYCRIAEKAAEGDPDLEAYCIADARHLYDALHELAAWTHTNRIALKGTMGQTAWLAAQDELGIPDSEISWPLWRHARRGDRGGRVCVIRPRAKGPGSHHDICNAYPAQLAKADLPVGACRELGGQAALRALSIARPGIYSLTVDVPRKLFLPPLPWTLDGAMNFPVGRFSGTWTLPELACAFDRGVSIVKVHSAIIWEATAPIFAPLVERWYEIRRQVGRKSPRGQWIGKLAKALAGKLAERPERSRTTMHPEEIKVCAREGACHRGCTGKCGAYEQLDLFGHIWAIPYARLGPSSYPQWSAYLRAMTRVQWLEQAERYGPDLCMGNTDSLWTIGRQAPEPLGDGLGQWEYQHAWTDLEVRSPTIYAFRDPAKPKQGLSVRGIPGLTEEDWKRGAGVIDRGIVTFGRAVSTTKGLFQKRHRRWSLPTAQDRIWFGDRKLGEDGLTYPVDAAELRCLSAERKNPGST